MGVTTTPTHHSLCLEAGNRGYRHGYGATGAVGYPKSDMKLSSSYVSEMIGHTFQCVERFCERASTDITKLKKAATPCIDGHHFSDEECTGKPSTG